MTKTALLIAATLLGMVSLTTASWAPPAGSGSGNSGGGNGPSGSEHGDREKPDPVRGGTGGGMGGSGSGNH